MLNDTISIRQNLLTTWVPSIQVIMGSIFLAVLAQFSIPLPFTPVPLSLQTLGVALLAIGLGPRKAALAVVGYLAQATFGLPVLAGGLADPLWMLTPRAGYLIGFVAAAFVTGSLLKKVKTRGLIKTWLILSLNETTILLLGSLWLAFFVGFDHALAMGVLPFIPGAIAKITLATTSEKPLKWINH